jgi:hypothetical protein
VLAQFENYSIEALGDQDLTAKLRSKSLTEALIQRQTRTIIASKLFLLDPQKEILRETRYNSEQAGKTWLNAVAMAQELQTALFQRSARGTSNAHQREKLII